MKYTKEYWDWNNSQDDLLIKRKTDNELIAEFIGLEYAPKDKRWDDWFDKNGTRITYGIRIPLQYDTSWDWLMPVVEKIENFIFDENNSYNVTIGSTNYCVIQDSNGDTIEIIKDNGNSKLDTTYQAVVEFINQYNKTI